MSGPSPRARSPRGPGSGHDRQQGGSFQQKGSCAEWRSDYARGRANEAGAFEDVTFGVTQARWSGLPGLWERAEPSWLRPSSATLERDAGEIRLDGHAVPIRTPLDAVRLGLALVPDDRKGKGLVTNASVAFNLGLTSQR
jgi:ABC-type sugar transport system ATPase subunit